jgi:hypothetical protein
MSGDNWKALGWKLVPNEPTDAMLNAAYRRMRMDPSCGPFKKRILLKAWDAMLEETPKPRCEETCPAALADGDGKPCLDCSTEAS